MLPGSSQEVYPGDSSDFPEKYRLDTPDNKLPEIKHFSLSGRFLLLLPYCYNLISFEKLRVICQHNLIVKIVTIIEISQDINLNAKNIIILINLSFTLLLLEY